MAGISIEVKGFVCRNVFDDHKQEKIEGLKGEIILKNLGYKDKQKLMSELDKNKAKGEEMSFLFDELEKRVEHFDVKTEDGSRTFESLDELAVCEEGMLLITELQQRLVKGFPLGKKKGQG